MSAKTTAEILSLSNMSMSELEDKWREVFSKEPTLTSRQLLIRHLAFCIQEKDHGGLTGDLRRRIQRRARTTMQDKRKTHFNPGTELLREYKLSKYC